MKNTLSAKTYTYNGSIIPFSMGIDNANEANFSVDMEKVWPGFSEMSLFQQRFLIYGFCQRCSDKTGTKNESLNTKVEKVKSIILGHETQKYGTGISTGSKPGVNIVKADVILTSLNTLATAKALTETVFEAILDGNTIVNVLGSAKESPNAGLRTYLADSETFDWDTIQDEVDDLQQEIILHARKTKAVRAANKAKKEAEATA